MKKRSKRPETFTVTVTAGHGLITVEPCHLHVFPGDAIVWKLDRRHAFAVIVKDFMTPLEWGTKVVRRGQESIRSCVRDDAEFGLYEYVVCAVEGDALLVTDPEIIVRPPDGRGK